MKSHAEACPGSRALCKHLEEALRSAIPDVQTAHKKGVCSFFQPGRNRVAYLFHSGRTSQVLVYLRGDPTIRPIDPGGTDSEGKVPSDSKDDEALNEGNAPTNDSPIPPKSSSKSKDKEEKASESDLAPKKKAAEGGCSMTTTASSSSTNAGLLAIALGAALVASSRRRKR